MKKHLLYPVILTILSLITIQISAQVSVSTDNSSADNSAILDVKSISKGFLIPRMTTAQIMAILNPANGLQVYCTTDDKIYVFVSSANQWKELAYGTGSIILPANFSIGTGGSCNNTIVQGNYYSGLMLTTSNYVTIQVNVTSIGSYTITTNPTNGYSFSGSGIFVSTGTQTVNLMGSGTPLLAQTNSFTAIASNSGGACSFMITIQSPPPCGNPIIDSRDGNTYTTVLIGSQCWMKQNLNYGSRISGTNQQTDNSFAEKYCYDNLESNCDVYGGLYLWDETMQYSITPGIQGICPAGWHLPSDAEWTTLTNFLGGLIGAGDKMKEAGTTHWANPITNATNESGFTALPGGHRRSNYIFSYLTTEAIFWSSTYSLPMPWARAMYNNYSDVDRINVNNFSYAYSVRCLKD